MVDIDLFKAINDTYGHIVGDQAIRHVAQLLETGKRTCDLVGRYGGEEFVVLLPHVTIDEAYVAAERLCKSIEETPCGSIRLTVSMGVSVTNSDGQAESTLLDRADQALYAAKHSGRNRVCRWDVLSVTSKNTPLHEAGIAEDSRNGAINGFKVH